MDATFITPTSASPVNTGLGGGSDASSQAGTPLSGPSFGDIFSTVRPATGRQDLAAPLLGVDLAMPTLVSQPLGSTLAVITPDSPTPDQASLLAFARSQGLDESAIAALWQAPHTAPQPQLQPGGSVPATPGAFTLPVPPQPSGVSAGTTAATDTAPATTPPQVMILGLSLGAPAAAQAEAHAAPPTELDPLALQQMRVNFLSQNGRSLQRPQASPPAPASPQIPSTGTPRTPQEPPTLSLDLESELADLMRADDGSTPTEALAQDNAPAPGSTALPQEGLRSNQANAASGTGTASAPPPVISGYQLKAEHYQQLADRMGQALAQRVQEQIERGQWSMTLRLNPAELGQIDVQLDMHHGSLDARFMADNAVTRDLIMQGSGRLKESLNEHGMTVASVWVNSDGDRQSGGNPTPQQQRRPASDPATPSRTETPTEARVSKPSRPDGWDMLA